MSEMFVIYWLELGEYVTPQMLVFAAMSALAFGLFAALVAGKEGK